MIGMFPDGNPDELLYSIVAQLKDRLGAVSNAALKRYLFGSRSYRVSVFQPNRLLHLASILPLDHKMTVDKIFYRHTLLPYFEPFTPSDRISQVCEQMKGEAGGTIPILSATGKTRVSVPETLQCCQLCIDEDKRTFGLPYWRRGHQLPGVFVCYKHKTPLIESDVATKGERLYADSKIVSLREYWNNSPDINTREVSALHLDSCMYIAENSVWLLNQRNLQYTPDQMQQRYEKLFWQHDLASFTGNVDTRVLADALLSKYDAQFLTNLNCGISEEDKRNWSNTFLIRIRMNSYVPPLYHLLILGLFDITAEQFFSLDGEKRPFGYGPWLCLNPICEHYRKPAIGTVDVIADIVAKDRVAGIFTCRKCGLAYRRRTHEIDRNFLRRTDIITYGQLWSDTFTKLWHDITVSLEQLVSIFDMNSTAIYEEAKRLKLGKRQPSVDIRIIATVKEYCPPDMEISGDNFLDACKLAWLEIRRIQNDSPAGKLNILRFGSLRDLLEKNDPEWYRIHGINKSYFKAPDTEEEWNELDLALAKLIRQIANDLKSSTDPFVRITESAIIDRMGFRSVVNNKTAKKMENISNALDEVSENPIQYAVRKVWMVAEKLSLQRLPLTRQKLSYRIHVKNEAILNHPDVQQALDEAIKCFSKESDSFNDDR